MRDWLLLLATMLEVARAVDALAGVPLAILHCVSEYPANPATLNLRAMDTLRMASNSRVSVAKG